MAKSLNQRPARTYKTGKVTRLIRTATIAISILLSIVAVVLYPTMPETIPTHFNFAGEADDWGPKSSVIGLLALNLVLPIGLAILSKYPRIFNYPAQLTQDNAQTLYRAGEQMMVWTAAFCAIIFAGIIGSTILGFNASAVLIPAFIGLLASVIVGLARMIKI